jgi:hypothetical protein
MKSTVYDLVIDARNIATRLADALDEDPSADVGAVVGPMLEELVDASSSKIDALYQVDFRVLGEAEMLDEQAKRLQASASRMRHVSRRVRDMARDLLEAHEQLTGTPKIVGQHASARLQKNTPAVSGPDDPSAWPEAYTYPELRIDKAAARRDLLAGVEIPGVELVQSRSIRWGQA